MTLQLDWKSYFKEFCRYHSPDGKYVIHGQNSETGKGGTFLFADGWRYSRNDIKGPEFPPPEDPDAHLQLIKIYWTTRLRIAEEELRRSKQNLVDLVQLQQRRSSPVFIVDNVAIEDDDGNVRSDQFGNRVIRKVGVQVNFDDLLSQIKYNQDDCIYCKKHLEEAAIPVNGRFHFNAAEVMARLSKIERQQ